MVKLSLRICALSIFFVMSASAYGAVYVDNHDGTVTDTTHGLMWQQADDGTERAWQDAGKYCEDLALGGHDDWRLPDINLLEKLIEPANSPTVPAVFSVKPSYYWSASESHNNSQSAKYVNFFYGNTYAYSKDNTYYVICVRETAKEQVDNLTASFSHTTAASPLEVHFTSTISGGSSPYFIEWDFGDGETSSVQSPTHVFASSGNYKVLLTVSDNDGAVTSAANDVVLSTSVPAVEETSLPDTGEAGQEENKDKTAETILPDDTGEAAQPAQVTEKPADVKPDIAIVADAEAVAVPAAKDEVTAPVDAVDNGKAAAAPAIIQEKEAPAVGAAFFMEVGVNYKNVAEIKDLGHGLLSYAFTNAMHGDADWNKDGRVTTSELNGYLTAAVAGLSQGGIQPVISLNGEDSGLCAAQGSTYLLAVGVNIYHDGFVPPPFVEQDINGLQQAIANKCTDSKTMVITGEHANRAEFLQALNKTGGMVGPHDKLIFYFAGLSEQQGKRLNLLFNDTIKGMTAFTGLFYDDITAFLQGVSGDGTLVMLETVRLGEVAP